MTAERLSAADAAAAAAAASALARRGRAEPSSKEGTGTDTDAGTGTLSGVPPPDSVRHNPAYSASASSERPAGTRMACESEEVRFKERGEVSSAEGSDHHRWLIGPVIGSFFGNALLLAVGALLAVVWQLFEEFREPLLWGLWCSIALRGAKEYLVGWLQDFLRARTLFAFVSLPVETVWGILCMLATDGYAVASSWSSAMDVKATDRASLLRVRALAEKMKAEEPDNEDEDEVFEDASEEAQGESMEGARKAVRLVREFWGWCYECMQLLSAAVLERKQHYAKQMAKMSREQRPSDTTMMFSALLSACLLYETYRVLESVFGWRMLFVVWVLCGMGTTGYIAWRIVAAYRGVDPHRLPIHKLSTMLKDARPKIEPIIAKLREFVQNMSAAASSPFKKTENDIRQSLLTNLDSFVAGMLCLAVLFGTLLGAIFFAVQIGSEMHGAFKVAMSVDVSMSKHGMTREGVMNYIPDWAIDKVQEGKLQAASVIKENMPKAIQIVEDQANSLVAQYNLTETVSEMYIMYATAQCLPCSEDEARDFAVEAAKANALERKAASALQGAEDAMNAARKQLQEATRLWELAVHGSEEHLLLNAPTEDNGEGGCEAPSAEEELKPNAQTCSIAGNGGDDQHIADVEEAVVECDASLTAAIEAHQKAESRLEQAASVASLANKKLQRCYLSEKSLQEGEGVPLLSGENLARFKGALGLAIHFKFTEAASEMKAAVSDTISHVQRLVATRDITGGVDTDKLSDPLASFGQAVVDPLMGVLQSVFGGLISSLGSSMSMLLSGGASIVNSIVGFIMASISFISFVGLLYFMLSLDEDPVDSVIGLLPVAPPTCSVINKSVRTALSGVFEVTAKLGFFHGVFTWLTLRMFGAHFVYLPTLAAILFSCFPFIPVTVVIIPAVLEFLFRGAWLRTIILVAAHLGAGSADDVIVSEVPGTNPFLTGMAIAGGMATFENSFQGALLGPMLVALLLMLKNLATELGKSHAA